MEKSGRTDFSKIRDIALMSLMSAVIAVSSWITIPYTVPFTMQTFAVFLSLRLLGGKKGTVSVILYVLLGAVGLPVFSGFRGGIGVLAGPTGGYITGFILAAVLYMIFEKKTSGRAGAYIVMTAGLILCYLAGTVQFSLVVNGSLRSFPAALATCVLPYIIPDAVKIILADITGSKIAKAAGLRR